MNQLESEHLIAQHGCTKFPFRPGLAMTLRLIALASATAVMVVVVSMMPASAGGAGFHSGWSLLGLMAGIGVLYGLLSRIQSGAMTIDWFGLSIRGVFGQLYYGWNEIVEIQNNTISREERNIHEI